MRPLRTDGKTHARCQWPLLACSDMTTTREIPRDEKTILLQSMERHRDAVLWKLDGLDDKQLRLPMVPSGTSLLGLVKHLAAVEYGWFCEPFGIETEPLPFDDNDPEADLRVRDEETTADVLAFYARSRAAANAAAGSTDLDAEGTAWFGETVTMRWVLVHMIEETARHAGHIDILRELIDGKIGDHDRDDD
ncbi:putative damage-inducible protein DinB [Streptacidiphilus sp. MAP5-52]